MAQRLLPLLRKTSSVLIVAASHVAMTATVDAQTCGNPNVAVCGQPRPPNAVNAPTPTLTVSSPATCTLPDDGYLKLSSQLRVDVAASVTGGCDHYYWGSFWYTQLQGINYVHWSQVSPSQQNLPNFAPSQPQNIDTTQSPPVNGSGAQLVTWNTLGATQVSFHTSALSTICTSLPTLSSTVQRKFNVVACRPEFWDEQPLPGGRVPPTTINVYLASSMSSGYSALAAAVTDWNNALTGSGLPYLNATETPCDPGSNTCVTVSLDANIGTCGEADGNRANGLFTDSITIKLSSTIWNAPSGRNFTSSGLQRTFSHELGHVLGLWDTTCATSSHADMDPSFYCDQNLTLVQPTFTDIQPVVSSLYGGKSRVRCGF